MKLFAFVALLSVAAAHGILDTRMTSMLLYSDLNNDFQINEVCRSVKKDAFRLYNTDFATEVLVNDHFGRKIDRDIDVKINHCCSKFSTWETKQCLKNIKDYVKVLKRQVFRGDTTDLWNMDRDYSMFEDVSDFENKYSQLVNTMDTTTDRLRYDVDELNRFDDLTIEGDYQDITDNNIDNLLFKKCTKINQCRRKIERTTDVVSRKACNENLRKSGRQTFDTCFKAGQIVGQQVGKHSNREVCRPSWYKFQTKTQGCGLNQKYECRKAFRAGCKLGKSEGMIKTQIMNGGDIIRSDVIRSEGVLSDVFGDDYDRKTFGMTNYLL